MGGGLHSSSTISTTLSCLQIAMVQLHSHQVSFTCLGGSKVHPEVVVLVGVLSVDLDVVDWGVEGVDFEDVVDGVEGVVV